MTIVKPFLQVVLTPNQFEKFKIQIQNWKNPEDF